MEEKQREEFPRGLPFLVEYGGYKRLGREGQRLEIAFLNSVTGKKQWKTFSMSSYEDNYDAEMAADEYRAIESDARGLTTGYFPSVITDAQRSFVAGFMDGDGTFQVSKNTAKHFGQVMVLNAQACDLEIPPIIKLMQQFYGGNITHYYDKRSRKDGKSQRRMNKWQCGSALESLGICYDVAEYGIIKAAEAKMIFDFVMKTEQSDAWSLIEPLKLLKTKGNRRNTKIYQDRINLPYIAGLFDANGHVEAVTETYFSFRLTQSWCLPILHAINKFFQNIGTVNENQGELRIAGSKALPVFSAIRPFSIHKRPQIDVIFSDRVDKKAEITRLKHI